ncbi:hypothetical protein CYQ88_10840 [Hydrogenovibrio sp. SC-1]|uniref:hypothetical protein n=1 Tax=Hydrogenovibrio sp. SC-1 TaxID=2065820 RepID=UPI000C7CE4A5|nr:hypothetical protein [Hydrogenovibrio sp. SC-1]PLA73511.1 hypothetical protein CYQ88_10840 [Hydrogenovibrio sp. SC-1]
MSLLDSGFDWFGQLEKAVKDVSAQKAQGKMENAPASQAHVLGQVEQVSQPNAQTWTPNANVQPPQQTGFQINPVYAGVGALALVAVIALAVRG